MGRPRQIDRDTILEASLSLAREGGITAVTMQAVAKEMGVTPMALYRHVESKSALLDGLVERLLEEVKVPTSVGTWEERLTAMGQAIRRLARKYPTVFPLLLQRPVVTERAMQVRDYVQALLREAGVAQEHVRTVEHLITTLAMGFATGEGAGRFTGGAAAINRDYEALVAFVRAGIQPFLSRG